MNRSKITFLVYLILLPTWLLAQDLEKKLLTWLEQNDREKLIEKFDTIKDNYPNSALPLFLEAFIEYDARKAVSLYEQIVKKYPKTVYAESATFKLGQYYFMIGSYFTAQQWFGDLKDKYPKSDKVPEAAYLSAQCLVATDSYEKAEKEIRKLIKKYPHSEIKPVAEVELERIVAHQNREKDMGQMIEKTNESGSDDRVVKNNESHTIQIGAFTIRENASKQRDFFTNNGYAATIGLKNVKNELFYCVRLGNFSSRDQAEDFGENLKQKYGISYQVVKND